MCICMRIAKNTGSRVILTGSFMTRTFYSSLGNLNARVMEVALYTMSAKSLGTLPVIYAVGDLQNPLPRTTMLFEGDRNSTGGRNGVSF